MIIHEKLSTQIPLLRERVKKLLTDCSNKVIDQVTIGQVYGGMRNVKGLVTDISYVDPNEGIRLRGFSITDLLAKLPRQPGNEVPLVGGLYYLLLVGELPTLEQALEVEKEWKLRAETPGYVFDILRSMPSNTPAMTMLSLAILAMQRESVFSRQFDQGLQKDDYWQAALEDSFNLTARMPVIAAFIYNLQHRGGKIPLIEPSLDLGANFARMMEVSDRLYEDLSRLYLIIHSDHESGNASAHAAHLIGSTLSDLYYAVSGGMNALAGPLHGRANQEALEFLMEIYKKYGHVPGKEELHQFMWDTLKSGQVIPGYGHAVLRQTDPRFTLQYKFGAAHFPEDPIFKLAMMVYDVAPAILIEQGKAKDPWPNVDAISGALQQHFGVKDCGPQGSCGFYTVLFGVSRALGISANLVWARALGQPIERPKSLTTGMLEAAAMQQAIVD